MTIRYIYPISLFMIDYRQELLSRARRYCEASGLALATVSNKVMNDGKFFDRLAAGKGCTVDTYGKVMRWFDENEAKPEARP